MAFFKVKKTKLDEKLLVNAKAGDAKAQVELSDVLYKMQKYDESFLWCLEAVKQNYIPAYFRLSTCYLTGKGTAKNIDESIKWLEKAAYAGDAFAEFNLGTYYYNGQYYEKNVEEGIKWLQRSADHGNGFAKDFVESYYKTLRLNDERYLKDRRL